jgi:aldehyde dehydrogenase family 7 protein A1
MPDADLNLAIPAVFFGAVGTAGQRCTSTRRLYVHRSIKDEFLGRLSSAYDKLRAGDPLDSSTLYGPLHTNAAVGMHKAAVDRLRESGAEILSGGQAYDVQALGSALKGGNWVRPTLAVPPKNVDHGDKIWAEETFAPVLCAKEFEELEEAIEWNNSVKQGLSSSLWTRDVRNIGKWLGPAGSDCGIVNVSYYHRPGFRALVLHANECIGECGHEWG